MDQNIVKSRYKNTHFARNSKSAVLHIELPRHDWLNKALPDDLKHQEQVLLERLSGKKMIMFALTWRINFDYTPLSQEKISVFIEVAKASGYILGLRTHPRM